MSCGQPGLALGEHDEGVEEVPTVFCGGGQVAADRAELLGSGEGAQAAGHLLPELDHAYVPLRAVVVRWCSAVGGEPEVVGLAVEQPAGERVVLFHHVAGPGSGGCDADLCGRAVELDLCGQSIGVEGVGCAAIASATSFCMVTSASAAWVAQHQSTSGSAASVTACSSRWAWAQQS